MAKLKHTLPSWNNPTPRKPITALVQKVTKHGSAEFVPVEQRIATFDNEKQLKGPPLKATLGKGSYYGRT